MIIVSLSVAAKNNILAVSNLQTYIGDILIAVNPYKAVSIYGNEVMASLCCTLEKVCVSNVHYSFAIVVSFCGITLFENVKFQCFSQLFIVSKTVCFTAEFM